MNYDEAPAEGGDKPAPSGDAPAEDKDKGEGQ